MRLIIAVIMAGAALGLTPAAAQNETVTNNEVTAPAPDANVALPDANAVTPVDQNAVLPAETAPVDTAATEPAPRRDRDMLPWGLLGLLGLIGLFGRKRST